VRIRMQRGTSRLETAEAGVGVFDGRPPDLCELL
jgi:hypothetical protein